MPTTADSLKLPSLFEPSSTRFGRHLRRERTSPQLLIGLMRCPSTCLRPADTVASPPHIVPTGTRVDRHSVVARNVEPDHWLAFEPPLWWVRARFPAPVNAEVIVDHHLFNPACFSCSVRLSWHLPFVCSSVGSSRPVFARCERGAAADRASLRSGSDRRQTRRPTG